MKVNFDDIVNQIVFLGLRSGVSVVGFIAAAVLIIQDGTHLLDDTWATLTNASNLLNGFMS